MITTRLVFKATFSNANQKLLNATRDPKITGIKLIEEALEEGANINVRDIRINNEFSSIGFEYTPLMWAAYNNKVDQVAYLLKRGANLNLTTRYNNTAFHIAAREGKNEVVLLLGNLYPELLSKQGQYNQLPQEIARANGPQRKINETFENNFYDPYFGTIKNGIAFEIALAIIINIKDPLTLKTLCSINKAWLKLTRSEYFQHYYQETIKTLLPEGLREFPWENIYQHYFPNSTIPEDPFIGFLRRIHTAYFVGHSIDVLENKPFSQRFFEGILAIGFVLAHQGDFPGSQKLREIPIEEIEDDLICTIQAYRQVNTTFQIFHELKTAAHHEYNGSHQPNNYSGGYCISRKPIVEIKLDTKGAIESLNIRRGQLQPSVNANNLLRVTHWRLQKSRGADATTAVEHIPSALELKRFK